MTQELVGQVRSLLTNPPARGAIAVLGDLGLDKYVFGAVERVSPEAPVLVLHAEREEFRLGCAANVLRNLAALGSETHLKLGVYGISGDDANADAMTAQIEALGDIDDMVILRDASRPTIVKTRFIAGSHHQLLRCDVESSASVKASLVEDLKNKIKHAPHPYSVLVIEDYGKGLLQPAMLADLFAWAREHGVMTMVDPNRNTDPRAYAGADLITPNILEAEILLGRSLQKGASDEVTEAAAREIQSKFQIKNVVLKRSAHGMTLVDATGQVAHFAARAKEVFDVTGAGDTVVAVLAAARAWGADLITATYLANLGAGLVVAKAGAATVDRAELIDALDHNH
ncbi:MAG TPA: PfkB family carbohydrate kinase [Bdellovibrionota bacterium]|nr:PfkB family carbohydrate kinase [Bdellovibrionota bacterium]